ncbi:MAG: acetylxylan esterase [Victivallaceae bacterium]|nr:acetylxylan esterase [Victivallaceae bacterium]
MELSTPAPASTGRLELGGVGNTEIPEQDADWRMTGKCSNPDGKYPAGGKVVFQFSVLDRGKAPAPGCKIDYRLFSGPAPAGKNVVVPVPANGELNVEFPSSAPGQILCQAKLLDARGQEIANENGHPVMVSIGAVPGMEKFAPAEAEAADFDAFWKKKIAALSAVGLKPQLKLVKGNRNFKEYLVTCDSVNGKKLTGILDVPVKAKPNSLPAVVYFYGKGVNTVWPRLAYGDKALVFTPNVFGVENRKPWPYYAKFQQGEFKQYERANRDDPEKYAFGFLIQQAVRAVEFVRTRPEWNRRTLILAGFDQGATLAIAASAFLGDVTLVVADAPLLANLGAAKDGHRTPWPWFYQYGKENKLDENNAKFAKTASYFDLCSFAKRMKAKELYLTANLADYEAPPVGVIAAFHATPGTVKKQLALNPAFGHWPGPAGEKYLRGKLGLK